MDGRPRDFETDRELTTGPDGDPGSSADAAVSVDIFVRSLAPPGSVHDEQIAVLARLDALEDRGTLEGWTVTIWGERICECAVCLGTRAGQAIHDQIQEFRYWAEQVSENVSLPFERLAIESEIAETQTDVLVPPRVTLAVYAGDRLLRVFPYTVDGVHHSVNDALDWLEPVGRLQSSTPVG